MSQRRYGDVLPLFSKKLIQNLKKTFCYVVEQLFLFEISPNTTILCRPSGYGDYLWARPSRPTPHMVFGCRPISRLKIENFPWTKCKGISILHTRSKFQASRFNNKKFIFLNVADPLNYMHDAHLCMLRQICTIGPSFFNMISGMHRCPIKGPHLVTMFNILAVKNKILQ